jgi:hypothetical protein
MHLAEALSRLAGQHPLLQLEITEPMVDFIGTAFWNFRNSSYEDAYCYGRDPEMAQLYERHFQFLDPIGARQNRLNARAKHVYEDVAYSELKKSEYFNDFLVRFGTSEGINASLFEGDRYLTDIRFWRGPSRMLLGPDECGMVELLRPSWKNP